MPEDGAGRVEQRRLELVGAQRAAFARRYGRSPQVAASAPGRINVIGEHTDYSGGLALPGAIDRWVVVTLAPRDDDFMRVHSVAFGESVEVSLRGAAEAPRGWGTLPYAAAYLLRVDGAPASGFDALIGGDVPRGAGVASSAAVEMTLLNGLRALFSVDVSDLELVLTAQRIEHEHLGAPTGLMDQYTSQFARAGSLMLIDFDALTRKHVEARLEGWAWLLLDTKVRHELADSAYGERVEQVRAALQEVKASDASVRSFRDLHEAHTTAVSDSVLRRRLLHYVRENDRVRAAVAALVADDATALGSLMNESHASLRDDYEVSCAELDHLADGAAAIDGCAGARMMGGGFGGCTLNLVRRAAVDDVVAAVSTGFARRFGYAPDAAVYRLVGGARVHDNTEQP